MSGLIDLAGRVALVTGAGQGAGRAMALALAEAGAGGVAVNDYVAGRAEAVAAEIEAVGIRAAAVPFDVGDLAAVRTGVAAAERALGPVGILVNNAGNAGPETQMGRGALFWEGDPAEWDRFFHTNLKGVMNCCHAVLPGMTGRGDGRIVTIVSDAGRVGEPKMAAYAAAKAGAAGFVRAIAKEAGRFGVTCNAVSLSALGPSPDTPEGAAFLASDQAKFITQRYAIRRMGRPEDVAGMVVFLCSEAAQWISGQTYPVNGGYSFAV